MTGVSIFISDSKDKPIKKVATKKVMGRWFAALKPGKYTAKAVKRGYYNSKTAFNLAAHIRKHDIIMSPELLPYQSRFVISWVKPDVSLLSYLKTPGKCVVSSVTRRCKNELSGAFAKFDQEKCSGHGPQTMTVHKWGEGKYWLFLRQISLTGSLRMSRAVVQLYHAKSMYTYQIRKAGQVVGKMGREQSWCVMIIDGKNMSAKVDNVNASVTDCKTVTKHDYLKMKKGALLSVGTARIKKDWKREKKPLPVHAPRRPPRRGAVSGSVINLVTGKAAAGATVYFTTRYGSSKKRKKIRADSRGNYRVTLLYGRWRAEVSGAGYADTGTTVDLHVGRLFKKLLVSPKLKPGALRFVLTWSRRPKDLDSYLHTPTGCTVWYRKRTCRGGGQNVHLDLDNTHGHGPETITVKKSARHGTYTYCIKQYSRRGSMPHSRAVGRIFLPSGVVKKFKVGQSGRLAGRRGRGRTWIVVQVDARTHKIRQPSSSAVCGPPQQRGFRRRRTATRRRRFRI
jgi:hypothetical protein